MLAIPHLAPGTRLNPTGDGLADIRQHPRDDTSLIERWPPPEPGAEDTLPIGNDIAGSAPG